ncbi:MAG: hypothetical protein JWN48_3144 [Myxococcaceae bacterium]|nr:hypothetical protein [Myxococcaceae bacterium]
MTQARSCPASSFLWSRCSGRLAVALLSLLVSAACADKRQATEIVVIVDSDLQVGSELKSLTIALFDRAGTSSEPLRSHDLELTAGSGSEAQYTLPLSLVLAPDRQDSARDFRLVVTGRDSADNVVVEQQAIASFRPGFSLRLDVFLGQRCARTLCLVDGQRSAKTCNLETGRCEEPAPSALPSAGPGSLAGYTRSDSAVPGVASSDAGASDAAMDAGQPVADARDDGGLVPHASGDAAVGGSLDLTVRELSRGGLRPVVAASTSGRAAVFWLQPTSTAPPHNELWVEHYHPSSGWGLPLNLSTKRLPDEDEDDLNAVMDESGNITLVWLRSSLPLGRRYIAASESWQPEATIGTGAAYETPALALDPSGNVMVGWAQLGSDLKSARFDAAKAQWNTLVGAISDTHTRTTAPVSLAADGQGNVFASWLANDLTSGVFANRYSPASDRWEGPTLIEHTDQLGGGQPALAAAKEGSAFAIWDLAIDSPGGGFNIFANVYDPARMSWSFTMPNDPRSLLGGGLSPKVIANPLGGFVVFWDDSTRTASASGSLGPAQTVGRPSTLALVERDQIAIAADARATLFAAWAQLVPAGIDVGYSYVARAGAAPTDRWADITLLGAALPDAVALQTTGYPQLALGAPGAALIAWSEQASGASSVLRARWVSYPSAP